MKRTAPILSTVVALTLLLRAAGAQVPPSAPATGTAPSGTQPATAPEGPDEVSVSFKDMSVPQLAAFLSDKMKKPVLISQAVQSKKISIICKKKVPLAEALRLIRQALLAEGVMVEDLPDLLRIRPVGELLHTSIPRIPAEESASIIKDGLRIVAKEFRIVHYDVGKMVAIVKPMLPSYAHLLADPDTRRLVVTDTAANLVRLEAVIASLDVPLAAQTRTEIIQVRFGDAAEICAIVRWLVAGRLGVHVKEITTAGGDGKSGGAAPKAGPTPSGGPRPSGPRPAGAAPPAGKAAGPAAEPAVVEIEPSKAPVTLVPHVSRNWIIAVAPAELMTQIQAWVTQFDRPREVERDYELYDVKHADVQDVARQIGQTLQAMPDSELRQTTHVIPFDQSKKLIVFGSKTGRQLVKDLLAKLDVEAAEKRVRKTFTLLHADAEDMAERIESLFSELELSYKSTYYESYRKAADGPRVTVVPDKRRNAITVITDSATMKEIEQLIREEDVAIAPEEVKPKVYELKYVNAGDMQKLLTEMFSDQESSRPSFWDTYFGSSRTRETKAVGRLLGQFTFQVLPSSNKLIVNTKSIANYRVIDAMIEELDRPDKAGLPVIVELKHANAEDLCEQLTALLAEPSTLARVRRASRGLTDADRSTRSRTDPAAGPSGTPPGNAKPSDPGVMDFWWQGFKPQPGEVPTSNLIGRIRFVPVNRRNALMVLAPEAYRRPIEELIEELDLPGRQVMIRARIGEIQHHDQTTLGLRIASDPSILPATDTAVGGSGSVKYAKELAGGTLVLGANVNVGSLINLLIDKFDMKILLEPTLTTSDNEASEYFDGQDVPVQDQVRTSAEGTSSVTNIRYEEVGTRLRVRPHITRGGSVDLMINLEISRIVPGSTALGNFIFDRREVTTHVIVSGGQMIMLSGIIRQEEFDDVRKVPLLGDLPGLGKLFRSIDRGKRNRELVVFLTPHVMSTPQDVDAAAGKRRETLDSIERSFDAGPGATTRPHSRENAP